MEVAQGRKGSFFILSVPILCGRLKESVMESPKGNWLSFEGKCWLRRGGEVQIEEAGILKVDYGNKA